MPKSIIGKWAVGLNAIFLLLITVFLVCMFLGFVTFDNGHWWDITVGISVPLVLSAFITGIIAFTRYKDKSILVYLSLFIDSAAIIFLLLHSLFISD